MLLHNWVECIVNEETTVLLSTDHYRSKHTVIITLNHSKIIIFPIQALHTHYCNSRESSSVIESRNIPWKVKLQLLNPVLRPGFAQNNPAFTKLTPAKNMIKKFNKIYQKPLQEEHAQVLCLTVSLLQKASTYYRKSMTLFQS